MKRINAIVGSSEYQNYISLNQQREEKRIFCKHGFDHLLAVSRIAYIYLLEQSLPSVLNQETVYAAGLLHDIGRWVQYDTGEDHALASARLALPLLERYGFTNEEIPPILEAIKGHRQKRFTSDFDLSLDDVPALTRALVLADDWSRDCINCQAQGECYKFSKTMLDLVY